MKTIKELEANEEIGHREKVIIKMWLNQYREEVEHNHQVSMQCARDGVKEEVLELIDELDKGYGLIETEELKARINGK